MPPSTNIAALFLDTHLCIRRFTPAATRLFSLIASDIGRPIGDIAQKFTDPGLLPDAAAVLQQPITPKAEVQAHDGRWYVRQVLPYRTRDNRTEGVVITFSDVAAEALQEARLYAESIVDTVREPLLVLDGDLRVCSANQSFYDTFHATQADTIGRLLYELGNREWDIPTFRTLLGVVLPQKHVMSDFALEATFGSIGTRTLLLNARVFRRPGPGLLSFGAGAGIGLLALAFLIGTFWKRKAGSEESGEVEGRGHTAKVVVISVSLFIYRSWSVGLDLSWLRCSSFFFCSVPSSLRPGGARQPKRSW